MERFANLHRVGIERFKAAAERTDYQLFDEKTKVERFLSAIVVTDPELRTAIAQVKVNKDPFGPPTT